jgi:predicted nucleotidyltransferase
MSYRCAFAV